MFYPEFQKEIPIFVAEKESVWKKYGGRKIITG